MALPWRLLWLVDPAGAHLARPAPGPRGPVFRRAAVFGPGIPGGSRQATDEEIAAMDAAFSRPGGQGEASLDEVVPSQVREAAQRLARDGAAGLAVDDRRVEARVVRFWRGDGILEVGTTAPDRTSTSKIRIPRRPDVDLLADHLAMALAED